ncbi:DinB family protein [Frankia sp. AgPm24]|uniref:DinB family protein n=1 Tax=Frankia sp. AgPm24 TaxID=631128 RepID=UPI00200F114E|nr:DinB family protein [Frankia sp. AgPm24]MCK9921824.1 DinB family protein [Frankia sp. AgPm24]
MTTAPAPAPGHASVLDAERADLLAELAAARTLLINTTRGVSDAQAGERPTVSALCLGGLIKHVASCEETWARFILEGPSALDVALPDGVTWDEFMTGTAREYPAWAIRRHNDFQMLPGDTLAGAIARYRQAAARTDEIVATIPDLSAAQPLPAAPWNEPGARHSVRRVLIHIIAETTQHAGHADLLRETIDGQTTT